jgi:hypothetical protein
MTVLFSGGVALADNLAVQGGVNTTGKTQVQQPGKPLVSRPVANTAQTVQPTQLQIQQIEPVDMRKKWAKYCELAWNATKMAVNTQWIPHARIQNVRIKGSIATCSARCLEGPDLGPAIRLYLLPPEVPTEVVNVFADSIAGAWKEWEESVRILGLHWYPGFNAFPGPQAPPTPSISTPLSALQAGKQAELTSPTRLAARIIDKFSGANISLPPDARKEIQHFSILRASSFSAWLNRAQVRALGQGPVPSFAPPVIPAAPVVGGYVIPKPGVITGNLR